MLLLLFVWETLRCSPLVGGAVGAFGALWMDTVLVGGGVLDGADEKRKEADRLAVCRHSFSVFSFCRYVLPTPTFCKTEPRISALLYPQ